MRGSWNRETRRGLSLVFLPWSQDSPALPQHYLMFHEYESAWMLLQRWTAPTRHVRHPKKGQYHRRGQSYPTVPSTACSELLTARDRDRPGENASCCDPDKGPTQRQGQTLGKVMSRSDWKSDDWQWHKTNVVVCSVRVRILALGGTFYAGAYV